MDNLGNLGIELTTTGWDPDAMQTQLPGLDSYSCLTITPSLSYKTSVARSFHQYNCLYEVWVTFKCRWSDKNMLYK